MNTKNNWGRVGLWFGAMPVLVLYILSGFLPSGGLCSGQYAADCGYASLFYGSLIVIMSILGIIGGIIASKGTKITGGVIMIISSFLIFNGFYLLNSALQYNTQITPFRVVLTIIIIPTIVLLLSGIMAIFRKEHKTKTQTESFPQPTTSMPSLIKSLHPGRIEGILSIILSIGTLCSYTYLGILGIILGMVAYEKGNKKLGLIGIILSVVFMILGFIIVRIIILTKKRSIGL